ncbi:ACP S-malonyltransferase [Luteibacter sahnii]|uniref:ACP S-malonyltransferase n=1 Tax=Luteibacter sahnii TaxID=3021977 RepID=UPI002A69CA5E|nr:ACP S-malonyltransferase [Luteibacter sp. PPL193]MDY1549884.1 ACP S-malonyltransferase [Luteibacter sp. PPL193]
MKTALLFSGQGSHRFQMGRALFDADAGVRARMQEADSVFRGRCGRSLLDVLYAADAVADTPMVRLLHSHAAIFMVEYALARTLLDRGLRVDMVAGASLGSFAAAAIAGWLDMDTAMDAVIEQAWAVERHAEPGAMIAVMGDLAGFADANLFDMCEVAGRNLATHTVLALPERHVYGVETHLRAQALPFRRLPVAFAFHSRWIDPAREPYDAYLRTLSLRDDGLPFACCARGAWLERPDATHFWSAVRHPMNLPRTFDLLHAQGDVRYIDVSPDGTMATFLKHHLPAGASSRLHPVMSPFGGDVARLEALVPRRPQTRVTRTPESHPMKAVIFPGQGSQFRGMGKDLFPLFPDEVRRASDILGYSVEDLCLQDSDGRLSQTQYTQPALYVVNALHYYQRQRRGEDVDAAFFAGHSLGEYNALHAAGVFSFETGLRLVKKRGELMGNAGGGGMAAVLGTSADEIRTLLDEHRLHGVDIANLNTPTQTVIAGDHEALKAAADLFARLNLRYIPLNVSAPFHSRHMQPVQAEFADFLRQFVFEPPKATVIANATARPYDGARIVETLASQIATPVHWVDSIRYVMGRGEVEFQEIGATILSKMVNEIRSSQTPIVDEVAVKVDALIADAEDAVAVDGARITADSLGSRRFKRRYGVRYAYLTGAMYRGVASADLVIRMGRAGFLSFFGAGGLSTAKIDAALTRIRGELSADQPFGMNLLANYEYPEQEDAVVDLYLRHGVTNVEAAAFMQMTPALVRFRLRGLRASDDGDVACDHRIVAKVSRPEVAQAFMSPPPPAIVERLLERGEITAQQAAWARRIPMSHDICVEADSGGHTDGGIVAVMLPPLMRLRDRMQATHGYAEPICMGLAGGIGGPEAAAAAFLLGADFIVTGSINQCTVESGMSADGKTLLQSMDIQDTEYAPAGDMFEIGAQVQVLKKSVFFPARANKLLSLYRHHDSLEDIPERTRRQLETTFFRRSFAQIWDDTQRYFRSAGMDHEIAKAEANPKHRMALTFRWYFAYCTRLAIEGKGEDRVNYQIQTGPALGSFNQWVKGTPLEPWTARHVDDIAHRIMDAAADHLTRSFARLRRA